MSSVIPERGAGDEITMTEASVGVNGSAWDERLHGAAQGGRTMVMQFGPIKSFTAIALEGSGIALALCVRSRACARGDSADTGADRVLWCAGRMPRRTPV